MLNPDGFVRWHAVNVARPFLLEFGFTDAEIDRIIELTTNRRYKDLTRDEQREVESFTARLLDLTGLSELDLSN